MLNLKAAKAMGLTIPTPLLLRVDEVKHEKLPELAAEIARLNCDVIFAPGAEAALNAVKQASRDTPNPT